MENIDKTIKNMTGKDYLEHQSRQDSLLDHDIGVCGNCYSNYIWAQTARDMIKEGKQGDLKTIVDEHMERFEKKWKESKYIRLWVSEKNAGRDPHNAFKAFGWTP